MQRNKVGWAKRKITPKNSVKLAGYAPLRRSIGVHDEIFVKALSFYSQEKWVVLLSYDLVAIDEKFSNKVRNELVESIESVEEVVISATHTHSAPEGTCDTTQGVLKGTEEILGKWNDQYVLFCIKQTVEAVKESQEKATVAKVKQIETEVSTVTANRNSEKGISDPSLWGIEFVTSKKEKALMLHYSCHPTVLNNENQLITKDFVYGIEKELSEYGVVFFLNGNAGDQSTRYTRKASTFHQAEYFGREIADKVRQELFNQSTCTSFNKIGVKNYSVPLKVKEMEEEGIKAQIEDVQKQLRNYSKESVSIKSRKIQSKIEGLRTQWMLSKNLKHLSEVECFIQLIYLNDSYFFTYPGEMYASLGLELQKKYKVKCWAYTNGFLFYLTDKNAFIEETYEALSSPFAPEEGEKLIREVEKIIKRK